MILSLLVTHLLLTSLLMSQSILDIHTKLLPLIGKKYTLPITKNKGRPGLFLEELLGIPPTSNCLDCSDGELKIFPVKKLKKGTLVPKETIAVTMVSLPDLRDCDFKSSRCCKKMERMLMVPYYRDGDEIVYLKPTIIEPSEHLVELYDKIESDYTQIRAQYIEKGDEGLTSTLGEILQTRTKGPGHGSKSRAFYLRPVFMKKYVPVVIDVVHA